MRGASRRQSRGTGGCTGQGETTIHPKLSDIWEPGKNEPSGSNGSLSTRACPAVAEGAARSAGWTRAVPTSRPPAYQSAAAPLGTQRVTTETAGLRAPAFTGAPRKGDSTWIGKGAKTLDFGTLPSSVWVAGSCPWTALGMPAEVRQTPEEVSAETFTG